MQRFLSSRPVVFLLASMSFACLLGQFYDLWTMRLFGCTVLPIATALLVYVAWIGRNQSDFRGRASVWIVQGAVGGIVAACAYDLYRLPFVLTGTPLFKVFGKFGQLLMGADGPAWLAQALGWTYHFSNGAALGIMFLAMVTRPTPRNLLWGALGWALCVEAILLMTPYTNFFGLPFNSWFIFLTLSAHAIFGVALGIWCRRRVPPRLVAVT